MIGQTSEYALLYYQKEVKNKKYITLNIKKNL